MAAVSSRVTDMEREVGLRGRLEQFGLATVLTFLDLERRSGELVVASAAEIGRIWLRQGQVIRARIAAATNLPLPVFEPAQIMHYSVGEEFRPHYDFLTEDEEGWAAQLQRYGQRIATFLLYLNDDFDGGETDFPAIGLSHRGAKGDALFFANIDPAGAPDRQTLHAGRPPSRGQKWILSQWIRNRTPAPA